MRALKRGWAKEGNRQSWQVKNAISVEGPSQYQAAKRMGSESAYQSDV